jgi:hypothetical protein
MTLAKTALDPKLALIELAEFTVPGGRWCAKRAGRFWTDLPYCIVQLKNGDWLPLNRYHKPLGQGPQWRGSYEQCSAQAWRFRRDPLGITGVWYKAGKGAAWLYDPLELYKRGGAAEYLYGLRRVLAATLPGVGGLAPDLTW